MKYGAEITYGASPTFGVSYAGSYELHKCYANRCNEKVPSYILGFCKHHLKMVSRGLQKDLWRAFQCKAEVMWKVNLKTAVERIDKKESYGQEKFY